MEATVLRGLQVDIIGRGRGHGGLWNVRGGYFWRSDLERFSAVVLMGQLGYAEASCRLEDE